MASYRVIVASSAIRELGTFPKKDRQRIGARLRSLGSDPRPPGYEKLAGRNRYRVRQGDYRIIYSIDDPTATVDIVKIGHRKEAIASVWLGRGAIESEVPPWPKLSRAAAL
ncbi:MAG TPA: type II toxin-antitoxin system RelE/ParE family toxin [Terriglobia bacterium]|nr:type II toxin-antitoxin system RelE/ParE family toxin [Terriglobia bacterium]